MRLIVKSGSAAGEEFEVDRELIAGRSPSVDIVIPDSGISSRHARLRPATGGIEVTDLDSTNGTFVAGTRITETTVVRPGDELRFSTTPLEVAPSIRMGRNATPALSDRPRLVVRTGSEKGHEVLLSEDRDFIIGRGTEANLQLSDPRVSERNTRVRLAGSAIEVLDLGSANGTLLDGEPVVDAVRAPEGSEIQVGDTVISFTRQSAAEFERGPMPTVIGRRPALSDSVIGKRVDAAVAATEKKRGQRTTVMIGGLAALVVGAGAIGIWAALNAGGGPTPHNEAWVVEQETPATVRVIILDEKGNSISAGSGSIIDLDKGLILTNNHVIAKGRAQVFSDLTKKRLDAELVGTSECDDLAVIRVPGLKDKAPGLKQVKFGDVSKLKQGERIVTLGYPGADENFEEIKLSTTSGIVSKVQTVYENDDGTPHHPNVIQTDAAVNHGNSGGPMFNLNGEQVGVNTLGSTVTTSEGQNYAISVGRVLQVLDSLKGGASPKWFGARFGVATTKDGKAVGLLPISFYPGSQATKVGLKGPDAKGAISQYVTQVNGKDVKIVDDYCKAMPDSGAATLTVIDTATGKTSTIQVTAGQN